MGMMEGGAGVPGGWREGVSQAAGVALAPGHLPPSPSEAGSFRGIAWEVTRRSELYFIMVRN